jgi:hypothetical protein
MDRHPSNGIRLAVICILALPIVLIWTPLQADSGKGLTRGQTVYVPIYSHIYAGDKEQAIHLAATLSIRNTDMEHGISIDAVDYYDSKGNRLKPYLKEPMPLGALASSRFVVAESDKAGGSGANFVVTWSAEAPVTPPVIESVMISTRAQLGISFTSRGQVVSERR